MSVSCRIQDGVAVISVLGRFNFALHQPFRNATVEALAASGIRSLEVNLYETEYIDSSALGMLLVLREQAAGKGITSIKIIGARGSVKQVLAIAKFEKFYTLD
ncbi:STAS domain-containing protein [Chitinimonas sp.]|uniref:STAS domain-containing protein n=1 Tax=Chitinimonas sp. TaxID=1934313 RepID=UPI0035B3FCC5